ncbi:hypothetical protein CVT24_006102 [Panaeolus cyanescens]|uniref:LYR motif-containing protein Cup1-like N-terminal domain-containing protein n=1 Tax=Panaeolus cyanescens TaxID=181874 RepID=A0A409V8S8_9AGAR|nr:hypothetical protein CVT24_006102 [Panaeolus cyanescens]
MDLYLHHFYTLKARDDIRAILRAKVASVRDNRLQRLTQDVHRMTHANQGNHKAFQRVLDVAYGRKGKLRRELLEECNAQPFLATSSTEKPPKMITFLERSRPPVYPPALRALLTNEVSRKTKPLKHSYMDKPPTLPPKADPKSLEALTFGRLSRRREVNIRWRYFTSEISKIYPPIEVEDKSLRDESTRPLLEVVAGGMQGSGVMDDIRTTIGLLHTAPPLTRRERKSNSALASTTVAHDSRHPSRWVRRRYRYLLGKLPIMVLQPGARADLPSAYNVGLSPLAFPAFQRSIFHIPEADDVTSAWNKTG